MEQLKTYGDVVNRLVEIIELSNQRKSELSEEELKNFNQYFVRILYIDIFYEYAEEFKDLLDIENTFQILINSTLKNKNDDLILTCQSKMNINNGDYNYYNELITILQNTKGKSGFDLKEYQGYLVLKSDYNRFLWLMRKLKLVPEIKDLSEEEREKAVQDKIQKTKEQYKRLVPFFLAKQKEEVKNTEKQEEISFSEHFTSSEFLSLLGDGIIGKLSFEQVLELRNKLTFEEYNALLEEFRIWHVFSDEELNKLKKANSRFSKYVSNIDELVGYFVKQKEVDIEALALLIPAIGKSNFRYLLSELYEYGAISLDDYTEYLSKIIEKSMSIKS